MSSPRIYTSRRFAIATALATQFNTINGSSPFRTNLNNNSSTKLKFWDEVKEFPAVFVTPSVETRQYQGGGYKDRFLSLTIRAYIRSENSLEDLESLLEDLETVIEENSKLSYTDKDGNVQTTHLISIISITSDEGVLAPLGVGEIVCEVRY